MVQFLQNTNFNFVKFKEKALIISGLCVLITIGAFIYNKGFNLAIDFVGGTMVYVKFDKPVEKDIGKIRESISNLGMGTAEVKTVGNNSEIQITVKKKAEVGQVATLIKAELAKISTSNSYEVLQEEQVGAKVSGELAQKALIAVLLSWLGILVYMGIRFRLSYGFAAIITLIHDAILTTGVFLVQNSEISLSFIAAILTVIGFSLNDTIVIFDRIRENLHSPINSGKSFEHTVNLSINQTLSRSVITNLTVFIVVTIFFFVGGQATRDLSLALMAGSIIGSYSTIFIAAPALIYWNRKWPIK